MLPENILALISDLYGQIVALTATVRKRDERIAELEAQLNAKG